MLEENKQTNCQKNIIKQINIKKDRNKNKQIYQQSNHMRFLILALIIIVSLANVNAQFSGDIQKVLECFDSQGGQFECFIDDKICNDEVIVVQSCINEIEQSSTSLKAIGLLLKSKCSSQVKEVQATIEKKSECYLLGEVTEDQQDNNNQKDQNNQNSQKEQDQQNNQDKDQKDQDQKNDQPPKNDQPSKNDQPPKNDQPSKNDQPPKNDNNDKENQSNDTKQDQNSQQGKNDNKNEENQSTNQNNQKDQEKQDNNQEAKKDQKDQNNQTDSNQNDQKDKDNLKDKNNDQNNQKDKVTNSAKSEQSFYSNGITLMLSLGSIAIAILF
ncbi:transmembrane protein, putative (macronuclear) [Tetrahymena thermophila SB210]|uniref:Transmembrane protein, putative n=1 Tax=Tetrahymena thermophila (strain SB210) TaxID=312017 RepID=Q22E84_TETTS|nr:transmembrane protein, putative [Tetrahymena thermophila SB210]EAR83644.1 transmembrane protein, putative [Tetrahymena thermophila SB210]|eukprot:XP_001031307.1 transmembrane protein, putative [Tetrahymena thermophila SB210]